MTEPTRDLLDTSVVIDHDVIDPKLLLDESAISSVTLVELAAGPHATDKSDERATAGPAAMGHSDVGSNSLR